MNANTPDEMQEWLAAMERQAVKQQREDALRPAGEPEKNLSPHWNDQRAEPEGTHSDKSTAYELVQRFRPRLCNGDGTPYVYSEAQKVWTQDGVEDAVKTLAVVPSSDAFAELVEANRLIEVAPVSRILFH